MFITYKTTNLITGEFYVGSHKTDNLNDGYLGSGKKLAESIEKYGRENHIREVIEIFDNREDSLLLERKLARELKPALNYGIRTGCSWDYINKNLVLDRVAFGELTNNKKRGAETRARNEAEYMKNPRICKECGRVIPYRSDGIIFCSTSCSAKANNRKRNGYKQKTINCLCCGKEMKIALSDPKKFCSVSCSTRYAAERRRQNMKGE